MPRRPTTRTVICAVTSLFALSAGAAETLPSAIMRIAGQAVSLAMVRATSSLRQGGLENSNSATPKTNELVRYPWKTGIVATIFWVGEQPSQGNPVSNCASSWDRRWIFNFGGYDDPEPSQRAADFRPASFVPRRNPFYVALPYNDVIDDETTKTEASKVVPWFKKTFQGHGKSVCHNRWVAVRHKAKTCYAQWCDCGPFVTNDAAYVFGDARPMNSHNDGAGIDLAPAVRDYLGFESGRECDWRFVELEEVPDGPWKAYGANNHFAPEAMKHLEPVALVNFVPAPGGDRITSSATQSFSSESPEEKSPSFQLKGEARLDELRRQRELWFKARR